MDRKRWLMVPVILVLLASVLTISGGCGPTAEVRGQTSGPPVILEIKTDPEKPQKEWNHKMRLADDSEVPAIIIGEVTDTETITVTCVAFDPDGDEITYDWRPLFEGNFTGSGPVVVWKASRTELNGLRLQPQLQVQLVILRLTDSQGDQSGMFIMIQVWPAGWCSDSG